MIDSRASRSLVLALVLLALNALAGCGPFPGSAREREVARISGGSADNQVGDYAAVGGGFHNSATAAYSKVGGGSYNSASVAHAVVGGGFHNTASGTNATIGGGNYNVANHLGATIGGGSGNTASSRHATVGGGAGNAGSGYDATIGGGYYNTVSGTHATVGGGCGNSAGGYEAVIGGGAGNTASATGTTIGGGLNNRVTDIYATVGGGSVNTAVGAYSTVPGGSRNAAGAEFSFASGRRAQVDAEHPGAFVYSDSSDADFGSVAADEFAVRSTGGVRFVTAIDSSGNPISGVELAPGSGSWSSLSDREAKSDFSPADGLHVLMLLTELPISTWNYTGQDPSIRHVGPTAQDFFDAFGVGEDAEHITTVDADGIALAAIQGLYRLVQEKDAHIATQQQRITALEARVAALEQGIKPASSPAYPVSLGISGGWSLFGLLLAAVILKRRI